MSFRRDRMELRSCANGGFNLHRQLGSRPSFEASDHIEHVGTTCIRQHTGRDGGAIAPFAMHDDGATFFNLASAIV